VKPWKQSCEKGVEPVELSYGRLSGILVRNGLEANRFGEPPGGTIAIDSDRLGRRDLKLAGGEARRPDHQDTAQEEKDSQERKREFFHDCGRSTDSFER
jgi:hypothetical protein